MSKGPRILSLKQRLVTKRLGTIAWRIGHFLEFVALGSLAAASNYVSRFPLDTFLPFEAAVFLAYLVGMIVAFTLFQRYSFKSSAGTKPVQIGRFCIVNVLGASLAVLTSAIFARAIFPVIGWEYHPHAIAHAIGISFPAVSSYFLHKHYTFLPPGKVNFLIRAETRILKAIRVAN